MRTSDFSAAACQRSRRVAGPRRRGGDLHADAVLPRASTL